MQAGVHPNVVLVKVLLERLFSFVLLARAEREDGYQRAPHAVLAPVGARRFDQRHLHPPRPSALRRRHRSIKNKPRRCGGEPSALDERWRAALKAARRGSRYARGRRAP
jgi:hypothetical protein